MRYQVITCPNCSTEIKLTESLAAPIVQATRKEYETKLAEKESDFSKREEELRILQKNINDSERVIDERVSEKIKLERASIAADEAKKAKYSLPCSSTSAFKEANSVNSIGQSLDCIKCLISCALRSLNR